MIAGPSARVQAPIRPEGSSRIGSIAAAGAAGPTEIERKRARDSCGRAQKCAARVLVPVTGNDGMHIMTRSYPEESIDCPTVTAIRPGP